MALKKNKNLDDTFNMLDGISEQVKESKQKQRKEIPAKAEKEIKPFSKPSGDYYRLDMVVRDTIKGANNHIVTTEAIRVDYKDYISTMAAADRVSITKYIHRLIDEDMEKNKRRYKQLKRSGKE